MADIFEIAGRIDSTSYEKVVTTADQVLDANNERKQSQINAETYNHVQRIDNAIAGLSPQQQDAIDVATKANCNEAKMGFYVCGTGADVADKAFSAENYVLGSGYKSGGSMKVRMTHANTAASGVTLNINNTGALPLYYDGEPVSASNTWEEGETVEVYLGKDGSDNDTYFANNVAGGSSGGAYDVSKHFPTGNGSGGNTYTLATALAKVPASARQPGMSVKFIESPGNGSVPNSGNKYVQYRYMETDASTADTFTNVANWQGVDDVPTAGSRNLVESGSVKNSIDSCFYPKEVIIEGEIEQARFDSNNSIIQASIPNLKIKYIKANVSGDYLVVLHGINTEPGSTTKLYGHNVGVFTNEPVIGSEPIYFTKRTDLNKGKIIITKVHLEENQYLAVSYHTSCGITSFFTNAGDIVTISKNVNDNDDNPVSSAAVKNAINTAVAPINSDLAAIENVLTIEDLLGLATVDSLKVDRSTKKIVTAGAPSFQIAYIFIPADTSYYGLSIGSTDNINSDYIQTIGISEEFPANDVSYIELDYQHFTNSGDRYTKDFSITDDMKGKYLIISTHSNVPITFKGRYLIDVATIKDTIFYRDFYDEQQYTRINKLYMDGETSKVLTSNTYQVAYWQIPADTIYDSVRVKSVDTRNHQYLQYIGITDVVPANNVPFVQKDYTRFKNTENTIIKDISITNEIKGKYLIVSTFSTISLNISGHRSADVLDEIENEMSELDERVTDLEEAQEVFSASKIYNPKINFRKQELRVLDIGNSFTNGALDYIKELMSDIYTVVKDESPSAAAIAAATQASSVITADSGGYTLSELASLMSSTDKATVGELTLGNSVSFKYDVSENTVVWTFTKSQDALDLSNIAHCVAYRGGGSFKNWYDVYHDQDTETYVIDKRFGGLSVNLSGTHGIGNGEQFRNVLTNNIWDIIIIHQASVYSDKYSQWEGNGDGGYLKELIRIIRTKQPQASIGYLFTHSSGSGDIDEFYANIAESVKFISSNYDIDWIIPYGTAIQNIRQSVINTSEHNLTSDNKHLARGLGHYVATCTYYQALIAPRYCVSVYGNPYTHKVTDAEKADAGSYISDFIDVTPENVGTAQMAAILACNDMYNVNNPDGVVL